MIKHILKLIWNRKRSNLLMIVEIFFSFLVLFAISGFVIFNLKNYLKPIGFEYENVWSLSLKKIHPELENLSEEQKAATLEKFKLQHQNVISQLERYPQIEAFSASFSTVPFAFSTMNNNASSEKGSTLAYNFKNDDHYPKVVGLNIVEGRWFNSSDDAARLNPVVVNQYLVNELFDNRSAVGKTFKMGETEYKIVGVVDEYRYKGEFSSPASAIFERINVHADNNWEFENILIKVKPGVGAEFEEKMIKDLSSIIPGWTMEVSALGKMRELQHKLTWVPMIALSVVGGFLILNVILGLFGVLWYNINRRYSEIGLRRATGATSGSIQKQFVGEVLVLSTFGILIGLFIAFQFPLLNVFNVESTTYFLAIFTSVIVLYLMATLCAWYPGRQASKIEPATALHEE